MSPTLLPEIYGLIIQEITARADLLSLSLCCSTFRHEAQRRLFSHPAIPPVQFENQKKFIQTIGSSPTRLGPMVRGYTYNEDFATYYQSRAAYTNDATAAFRAMCNLKQLTLITHSDESSLSPLLMLVGCALTLDAFRWLFFCSGTTVIVETQSLHQFLSAQPRLRYLGILGHAYGTLVRFDDYLTADKLREVCPILRSVQFNDAAFLGRFLEGRRSISRLQWDDHRAPHQLTEPQFSQLEYLELYNLFYCVDAPLFGAHLTSLILLDVMSNSGISDSQLSFLADIPRLRTLIDRKAGIFPDDNEEYLSYIRNIFTQCKALEEIYVRRTSEIYLFLDKSVLFERFCPPNGKGEMERRIMVEDDVYSWSDYSGSNYPVFK